MATQNLLAAGLLKTSTMAELKTKENDGDVVAFLESVENQKRRADALVVLELMKDITGEEPQMWGSSIVGFGHYNYKYASGREGTWMCCGFSPRKTSLTLYIMDGFDKYEALMSQLGKYKTGKSCLYIKKLEDVNLAVLNDLIAGSYEYLKKKN